MAANTTIVKGSMEQVARQNNIGIAETWLNARAIIYVDISDSMGLRDASRNRSRWEAAKEEMERLQGELPGKIALFAFSSGVGFYASGKLPEPCGGTDVAGALNFGYAADAFEEIQFFLISDGEPNDEEEAILVARKYTHKINTIYVGPAGENTQGRAFLRRLAAASGGAYMEKPKIELLAKDIKGLLEA